MAQRDKVRRLPGAASRERRAHERITRNGLDWTKRFAGSPKPSHSGRVIVDGEAVVIEDGRTNFSELQAALAGGKQGGSSTTPSTCSTSTATTCEPPHRLSASGFSRSCSSATDWPRPCVYSEHLTGNGDEMFAHAAKLNWEGIVSKNPDAPYRSDRNEGWLKIKTAKRGTFPVIGFVKDPTGVAALYLGKQEGGELVYMGKVGTGWSRTTSSKIRKQLDTVVSRESPLTKPVRKPKATWVEPTFVAEVEYRDITSEGLLRQSRSKG